MREFFRSPAGIRTLTDWYVMVMVFLFPLFTGLEGYNAITEYKFGFFVIATGLWLLCAMAYGLGRLLSREGKLPRLRAAQWAAVAFLGAMALSALCSPYPGDVLLGAGRYDGLVSQALYCGIFLGLSALARPRKEYLYLFAASMLLCCGVAVVQLFGKNALWLFPDGLNYYDGNTIYSGEFLGTIGNTNLLSGVLCLLIPLCLLNCVTEKHGSWTALLLASAALGAFVLAASRVSGGAVALVVCAAWACPLLLRRGERIRRAALAVFPLLLAAGAGLAFGHTYEDRVLTLHFSLPLFGLACAASAALCGVLYGLGRVMKDRLSPRGCSRLFGALAVLAAVLALAVVYFRPGEQGTLYELSQVLHGHVSDKFGSSRIRIWREALALFPERPLLGGGPDTLVRRMDLRFSRYIPELGYTRVTFVDNAHNEYLSYLVNMGLLGFGTYLAMQLCSLVRMVKTRDEAGLLPALGCALLCYWVQSLFGLGLCLIAPLHWIVWGLFESRPAEGSGKENASGS